MTDPEVTRPEHPYGWPPGGIRWPGNVGAVNGSRVEYSNLDALMRDYPEFKNLDRLGGRDGEVLTVSGTPFEQRSLTPGHTSFDYTTYRLADQFPANVRGEVSIIAPALGFPGGGWQIMFKEQTPNGWLIIDVARAIELGVFE